MGGWGWEGLGCGLGSERPTDLPWLPWQPGMAGDGCRGSRGGGRWRCTREGMDRRRGSAGSCGQPVFWPGRGSAGGVATHRTCGPCFCALGRGRAGRSPSMPHEACGRVPIDATRVAVIRTQKERTAPNRDSEQDLCAVHASITTVTSL